MLNLTKTRRSVLGQGFATLATALVLAGPALAADYTLVQYGDVDLSATFLIA
jgi:hypothetical protein